MIRNGRQNAEVERDDDRDEGPEQKDELALRDQIGFAGLIDQFGNFEHGAMDRQVLQLHIDGEAEQEAAGAEEQADHQKGVSVEAAKVGETDAFQVRQDQIGFATAADVFRLRVGECGKHEAEEGRHGLVVALRNLDGGCDLLHRGSCGVRPDHLTGEDPRHNERQHTHG